MPMSKLSWIDMSTIRNITPAAALALTSEYDRLQKLRTNTIGLIDVEKWDDDVFLNLYELGLFSILHLDQAVRPLTETAKTVLLPMRSRDLAEPDEALHLYAEIKQLIDQLEGVGLSEEQNRGLRAEICGILIEAMENVASHAYPSDAAFDFTPIGHWWMTAAVKDNKP